MKPDPEITWTCPNCGGTDFRAIYLEPVGYPARFFASPSGIFVRGDFGSGGHSDGGALDELRCIGCDHIVELIDYHTVSLNTNFERFAE